MSDSTFRDSGPLLSTEAKEVVFERLRTGSLGWTVTDDRIDAKLALMAVHAHPDDEASKGAATLAKYADEGVRTIVVTCTGGERGEVLNEALREELSGAEIAEVRRAEMHEAARALKLTRHYWLGFEDSGMSGNNAALPDGCFASVPLQEPVRRLVELIRLERPQVLITYDEMGGYPHPDHIRTHQVSIEAAKAASDPGLWPELGKPHSVAKIYYHVTFSRRRLEKLHSLLVQRGLDSPFKRILESRASWPEKEVTTKIFVVPWLDARRKALMAHRSQIAEDSFFLALPDEVFAEHFPYDEYHLARASSEVEVELPETDLFANIAAIS